MMFGGKAVRTVTEKEKMDQALAQLLGPQSADPTQAASARALTPAATPVENAGLFGGARPKGSMPSNQSQALVNVLNPAEGRAAALDRPNDMSWGQRFQRLAAHLAYGQDGVRAFDQERGQQAFADRLGGLIANTEPKGAQEREAMVRTLIARHAAQGNDVSQLANYLSQNRQQDQITTAARGLPPQLQAFGQLAPTAGAAFMFGQHENTLIPGRDGAQHLGNMAEGNFRQVIAPQGGWDWMQGPDGSASPRPGGPADPGYLRNRAYQATSGEVQAMPQKPAEPMNQSQVVAAIMQKAARGEPLSEWEQRVMESETALPQAPQMGFPFMMPGMTPPMTGQSPQSSQPRPGAGPSGRPQASGGVARPQSDADFAALPRGARYIDPDDGQLYEKQ